MVKISATSIKNAESKNDLIIYARSIGCRAIHSNGLAVECETKMQVEEIKQKIKELNN